MKKLIPFSIAAALAYTSFAQAQTVYTKPSGYVKHSLLPNKLNLIGMTLQNNPIASGLLTSVSGNTLTSSTANIQPVAGRTYVFEILNGTVAGAIQAVTATNITSTTITTTDNLSALGAAAGDKFSLRLAPTLQEVFGTTSLTNGGTLFAAASSASADNVWVSNGSGGFVKYFLHPTGQFRISGTFTPATNIPIIYADGVYIQKTAPASISKTLVVLGQVKTTNTNQVIAPGTNTVSIVSPVGLTLRTAGFEATLIQAASPASADNLSIPQADGSFVKYFRRSGNWRLVSNPTVDLPGGTDPILPSAVIIQRSTGSGITSNLKLTVPSYYTQL